MGAREEILAALRRSGARATPLPDLADLGVRVPDPVAQLAASVVTVGGACIRAADRAGARRVLADLPPVRDAARVVSLVPDLHPGTVDLAAVRDAHELDGLEAAILPGEFAVAENGAVWLDCAALAQPVVFVIAEHLVLVLDVGDVVADMHEAYARLERRAPGSGVFISGPSKTADIEQALVIGAHGPRSATLVLVGA